MRGVTSRCPPGTGRAVPLALRYVFPATTSPCKLPSMNSLHNSYSSALKTRISRDSQESLYALHCALHSCCAFTHRPNAHALPNLSTGASTWAARFRVVHRSKHSELSLPVSIRVIRQSCDSGHVPHAVSEDRATVRGCFWVRPRANATSPRVVCVASIRVQEGGDVGTVIGISDNRAHHPKCCMALFREQQLHLYNESPCSLKASEGRDRYACLGHKEPLSPSCKVTLISCQR